MTTVTRLLQDLTQQPSLPDAACQDHRDLPWVPDNGANGGDLDLMRAICHGCPEMVRCRQWALSRSDHLRGMWGGLSAAERRTLREARR